MKFFSIPKHKGEHQPLLEIVIDKPKPTLDESDNWLGEFDKLPPELIQLILIQVPKYEKVIKVSDFESLVMDIFKLRTLNKSFKQLIDNVGLRNVIGELMKRKPDLKAVFSAPDFSTISSDAKHILNKYYKKQESIQKDSTALSKITGSSFFKGVVYLSSIIIHLLIQYYVVIPLFNYMTNPAKDDIAQQVFDITIMVGFLLAHVFLICLLPIGDIDLSNDDFLNNLYPEVQGDKRGMLVRILSNLKHHSIEDVKIMKPHIERFFYTLSDVIPENDDCVAIDINDTSDATSELAYT